MSVVSSVVSLFLFMESVLWLISRKSVRICSMLSTNPFPVPQLLQLHYGIYVNNRNQYHDATSSCRSFSSELPIGWRVTEFAALCFVLGLWIIWKAFRKVFSMVPMSYVFWILSWKSLIDIIWMNSTDSATMCYVGSNS